jgi:hypothetical protein
MHSIQENEHKTENLPFYSFKSLKDFEPKFIRAVVVLDEFEVELSSIIQAKLGLSTLSHIK